MALTNAQTGDYFILDYNMVVGTPKSGYTPVKGNLVQRETAQNNEFDVCADTQNPVGIVQAVNANSTLMTVALFVPGTTVVLPVPTGAVPALGDDIRVDDGGMVAVGLTGLTRTRVETHPTPGSGVGKVISRDATNLTVTVEF